jgi:ABC-2 type transport system ATP-binding protein
MIEVRELKKCYRDRPVLDGISFSIAQGEVVGFLGPNGAGKTTTMRILTGYLRPTAGTVTVAGHDVVADPMAVKALIGYLPEQPPLYDEMRVIEYLQFVAKMRGLRGEHARDRVAEVLSLCSLEGAAERLLSELSKGFRQRAGIAQALVADPKVLILDEPTSGLDPVQAARTRELVRQLAKNRTILFSTHILSEVEAVADRVIMMVRGKVAADGPIRELAAQHPADRFVLRFERAVPEARSILLAVPGVREVAPLPEGQGHGSLITLEGGASTSLALLQAAAHHGWPVSELAPRPQGLERLFFSVLGEEVRA